MRSPMQRHQEALAKWATEVHRLRADLMNAEREAGQLLDGEDAAERANDRVHALRILLFAALTNHFDEVHSVCPIHGVGTVVACTECVVRHPDLRSGHESYLAAVRATDQAAE
jgi:hypothetical protein